MEVEGQQGTVDAQSNQEPDTVESRLEAMQEQIEKLTASKERVLAESKEYATKYRSLRDQVSTKEREELEAKENWKELLEKEKEEKFTLQKQYEDTRKMVLKKELNFEIAKHAGDAKYFDDVLNNVINSGMVEFDEDSLKVNGITDALAKVREEKPDLFKAVKHPAMVNGRPTKIETAPKEPAQMTKDEKKDALKGAISQLLTT